MVPVTIYNQALNDKQIRRERRRQRREKETLAATDKITEITANGFSDMSSYYENLLSDNIRTEKIAQNSLLFDINRTNACGNIQEKTILPCGMMKQQIQLCNDLSITGESSECSDIDFTVTREYRVPKNHIPINTTLFTANTNNQLATPQDISRYKQKRHSSSTEFSSPVKKSLLTPKNIHHETLTDTDTKPVVSNIDLLDHTNHQTQPTQSTELKEKTIVPETTFSSKTLLKPSTSSTPKPVFPASNFKSASTRQRHQIPQIIHYVRQGKIKSLERYLAEHPNTNINATDERERTTLHYAAMLRNEKMVMMLLTQQNIDVNVKDRFRKTPLRYAVESNSLECVKRLVENGANPTHTAKDGLTPFEYALHYFGDHAFYVTSYLFQKYGADKTRLSCLHRLALDYHELTASQIAEELILLGADVNAIDGDGKTPLMYAVERKNDALIRVLVEQRSNLFQEDDNGKHIFNYAAAAGMKYAAMFQKELLKHLYKQ